MILIFVYIFFLLDTHSFSFVSFSQPHTRFPTPRTIDPGSHVGGAGSIVRGVGKPLYEQGVGRAKPVTLECDRLGDRFVSFFGRFWTAIRPLFWSFLTASAAQSEG